jgi:GNAT superfamily N-acetyltransferase
VTQFARESVEQVVEEIQPLLTEHWAEIAQYPDIALNPDFAYYRAAEAAGQLRIYTARHSSHALIGYAIYLLAPALHYQQSLQAKQDVLYISEPHRLGRVGWRLIQFADEQLKATGVQLVYQHQKVAHPALGRVLERLGYVQSDVLWARRLD